MFGHQHHPLGYPCAKFHFCGDHHWWTSRGEKSRTQSPTHSLTQLIWCPGNQSFLFGTRMPSAVKLSWLENAYARQFWVFWGILTNKVGATGLVFGVLAAFISTSVHARLQVSVCRGYDIWHRGWQFFLFLHFDPHDLERDQTTGEFVTCSHVRCYDGRLNR